MASIPNLSENHICLELGILDITLDRSGRVTVQLSTHANRYVIQPICAWLLSLLDNFGMSQPLCAHFVGSFFCCTAMSGYQVDPE